MLHTHRLLIFTSNSYLLSLHFWLSTAHFSLFIFQYSLLLTSHLLLTLTVHYWLFALFHHTPHSSLFAADSLISLFITHFSLLSSYSSLLIFHCILFTTNLLLLQIRFCSVCTLLDDHPSLLTIHSSLFTAYFSILSPYTSFVNTHCILLSSHFSLLFFTNHS